MVVRLKGRGRLERVATLGASVDVDAVESTRTPPVRRPRETTIWSSTDQSGMMLEGSLLAWIVQEARDVTPGAAAALCW